MRGLRRRLRAADPEAGMSLAELLVAMMLSAMLLALVGTMFVSVAKATTSSNQMRDASGAAGVLSSELSEVIRFGVQNAVAGSAALDPAVVAGTASSVTLYSLVDTSAAAPAPTKIKLSIQDGNLLQERWKGTKNSSGYWTFASTSTITRLPGPIVLPTAGQPSLFTYLDSTGAVLTPVSGALTAAQRNSVAAIQFSIRVRSTASSSAKAVVIQNTVGMSNVANTGDGS